MAKNAEVTAYFDEPTNYFGSDACNVAIIQRQRIVNAFIKSVSLPEGISILDIGCGNGLVSLPSLRSSDRLTLLDMSNNMIIEAQRHVRSINDENVEFIVGDVMDRRLQLPEYDLVLAIGLLAHVESPEAFFDRLSTLTRPGGYLIVQNTDASHVWKRLYKLVTHQRSIFQANSYALNEIASFALLESLSKRGFACIRSYRYELRLPFIGGLLSKDLHSACVSWMFGEPPANRFGSIGSKCLYMLRKE